MIRFKLLFVTISVSLLLLVMATAVIAQEEIPPPYAGLNNPFSWSDTSVHEVGKAIYQQSCLGCHGVNGSNLAESDFSSADYPHNLEERADYYLWILSEGRLDEGMPPYKSSLSEEQRWQVLTYIWSLGQAVPPATSSPDIPPTEVENATLLLSVPQQVQAGQLLDMNATLSSRNGDPIRSATVKFFIEVDFFTSGLMEIGDVLTDEHGVAVLEYTPRQTGDIQVVARYGTIEATAALTITATGESFYQAEAGIRLPAPGDEVFVGPESALGLGEENNAPTSAFRLPGGILSWLLLLVGAVVLTWGTYFRAIYHVFRIPIVSEIRDTDTRLVPLVGLALAVVVGIVLALMFLTGPYSHFHLHP